MDWKWFEKNFGWVRHKELHLKETKEILYDGFYYDVSKFIAKHSGGTVIEVFADSREDATIAVQQFHNRSIKKVLAIMKSLPHRKANENDFKCWYLLKQIKNNYLLYARAHPGYIFRGDEAKARINGKYPVLGILEEILILFIVCSK